MAGSYSEVNKSIPENETTILLGKKLHNICEYFSSQTVNVTRYQRHPGHKKPTQYNNDITIFHFSPPVTFNHYVSPACVPEQGQKFPAGSDVYAIGWGNTQGKYDHNVITHADNLLNRHQKFVKVMFLHLSVILSREGCVCLSACWDTPPQQTTNPPGADTPVPRQQTPPEQTPPKADNPPGSRQPPGADPPQCMLGDMGNKRAVCILLECILVDLYRDFLAKPAPAW